MYFSFTSSCSHIVPARAHLHMHTVWVQDEESVVSDLKYYKEESKLGGRARQRWMLSYTHGAVREPGSTFIVKEIQEMLKEAGYKTEYTV